MATNRSKRRTSDDRGAGWCFFLASGRDTRLTGGVGAPFGGATLRVSERMRSGERAPWRHVEEARRSSLRRTSPSSNSILTRCRFQASPINRIFSISTRSCANKAARAVFEGGASELRIVFWGEDEVATARFLPQGAIYRPSEHPVSIVRHPEVFLVLRGSRWFGSRAVAGLAFGQGRESRRAPSRQLR